jgi:hypothetical protein
MQNSNFITCIVSSGQAGVDRAALDAAKMLCIPYAGWCPQGCWAEGAAIAMFYENLKETPSSDPMQRTEWNVRDSDGTIIIVNDEPRGDTLYSIQMAQQHNKPHFILITSKENKVDDLVEWIKKNSIHTLNVAGPRASEAEGIYDEVLNIMRQLINHPALKY